MDLPIIMIRPVHPDRWSYVCHYLAALSPSSASSVGAAVPNLSFVVREGPSDALSQAIVAGLAFTPLTPNGPMLGIYARQR